MINAIHKPLSHFYEKPYQIIFIRPDCAQPTYEYGIVYETNVIAANDGAVFTTLQIMACARKYGIDYDYAIIEAFEWKPIDVR